MRYQNIRHGLLLLAIGLAGCVAPNEPPPPKTIIVDPQRPASASSDAPINYQQDAATGKTLVSEERAKEFVEKFAKLYTFRGESPPVFSIRVNPGPDGKGSTGNQLPEQQSIADYVRFFGRPLRDGQFKLVDEDVARRTKPDFNPDIVLNVYASVKTFSVRGFNGEMESKTVPDVQVTAIQLSDGSIVGQASTADLIGHRPDAWVAVQRVGVPEVLRSTALDLLEDMVLRKLQRSSQKLINAIEMNSTTPNIAAHPPVNPPVNLPPPVQEPVREISADMVGLINNIESKETAKKLSTEVAEVNTRIKEVNAWEVALFADRPAANKQPNLVKNVFHDNIHMN